MPSAVKTRNAPLAVRLAAVTFALVWSAILHPAAAQNSAAPPPIAVSFHDTAVTASGVTRGGHVVFFAIAHVPQHYSVSINRWKAIVSDDDRDGVVVFDAKTAIPQNSIWAIVDLSTRQFAVATPTGEIPETIRQERTHLNRGASGKVERFGLTSAYADMLYVSPNGDAWTWSNIDGSVKSINYHGYDLTLDAAQARPVSSDKGQLHEFAAGGVIIFFDWFKMSVLATQLDAAAIGGAQ